MKRNECQCPFGRKSEISDVATPQGGKGFLTRSSGVILKRIRATLAVVRGNVADNDAVERKLTEFYSGMVVIKMIWNLCCHFD
jgi:hypothetical protein